MPKARRRMLTHRLHGAEGGAGVRGSLPAAAAQATSSTPEVKGSAASYGTSNLQRRRAAGCFDPRGSRQMDTLACPLDSLPAEIKKGWHCHPQKPLILLFPFSKFRSALRNHFPSTPAPPPVRPGLLSGGGLYMVSTKCSGYSSRYFRYSSPESP